MRCYLQSGYGCTRRSMLTTLLSAIVIMFWKYEQGFILVFIECNITGGSVDISPLLCNAGDVPGLIHVLPRPRWPLWWRKCKPPAQSSLASRGVTCTSSVDTGLSANSPSAFALLTRHADCLAKSLQHSLPAVTWVRHMCRTSRTTYHGLYCFWIDAVWGIGLA